MISDIIDTEHLQFIKIRNYVDVNPFMKALVIRRSGENFILSDIKNTQMIIEDYLEQHEINHGVIIRRDYTLVFVEDQVELNSIMLKLATSINVLASEKFDFNRWLYQEGIDKSHPHFGHLIRGV